MIVNTTSNGKKVPNINAIFMVTGIMLIISGFVFNFTKEKDKYKMSNDVENNSFIKGTEVDYSAYNGVYSNGDTTLYLYWLEKENDKGMYCNFESSSYYVGGVRNVIYDVKNGVIEDDNDSESFKITLENGIVDVGGNNNNIDLGRYVKQSDFKLEDYFRKEYGLTTYLNTEYSGLYKDNDRTLLLYQDEENQVEVYIVAGLYSYYANKFEIQNDGTLIEITDSQEDGDILATILMGIDEVEVSANDIRWNSSINGTYKKVKNITIMDVINNSF
jgi:hypothetical protein